MKNSPEGLQTLEGMEYPGRVIILGRDQQGKHSVVIYAITGRSPSSRARELIYDGMGTVKTCFTDTARLEQVNEQLLLYNCIRTNRDAIIVSNGAQTDLIVQTMKALQARGEHLTPGEILQRAFASPSFSTADEGKEPVDLTSYEPDRPNFTPRISGCIFHGAAMSIIKRARDGSAARHYFEIPLIPGRGKLIATYQGESVDPLAPFRGEPHDVTLAGKTAQELAHAVYSALAPRDARGDFRVGVAAMRIHQETGRTSISIINRHQGER